MDKLCILIVVVLVPALYAYLLYLSPPPSVQDAADLAALLMMR